MTGRTQWKDLFFLLFLPFLVTRAFFAVQTFSQTFLQRRREALDLADSEWEEDASEWEDNTEENSDHRPAHEAGGGETFVSKGSFFFHKLTFKSA